MRRFELRPHGQTWYEVYQEHEGKCFEHTLIQQGKPVVLIHMHVDEYIVLENVEQLNGVQTA